MGDLEPISPQEAVDLYLEARDDAAENTMEAQDYGSERSSRGATRRGSRT